MQACEDILRDMDFTFFATGEYGMTMAEALPLIGNDHFLFLDVRAREEVDHLQFPFAKHIPLNEIPDRLDEIPRDKFIIPFCATAFRAAMCYLYLLSKGYEEVKGLTSGTDAMAASLKPGPLAKIVA
ncbi:rhodanese-like domain-containing protein [Desulfoplanes formicivorans]|uniref:Rhodanese n=1 Tax=Desulfoplanes formicivorans TaxID=1592317 RepID=A0A194ALA4_9BACT|nr:rhodanese-like domain-containing protein [Desulfoplanes formicivorans]GAU09816.1 rhodanese [Desulfoplanes formicivorans]